MDAPDINKLDGFITRVALKVEQAIENSHRSGTYWVSSKKQFIIESAMWNWYRWLYYDQGS